MSDELTQQEKEIVSEITKAMKDEGYSEEEIRQGLELAYHIRTKVKSKDNEISDCCE